MPHPVEARRNGCRGVGAVVVVGLARCASKGACLCELARGAVRGCDKGSPRPTQRFKGLPAHQAHPAQC